MRLKSFMKSSGLAALAASLVAVALPSAANAQPNENGRGRDRDRNASAPAPQQQAGPRNWGGDRNGDAAGRGWSSQRPAEVQRNSRDGSASRPEPALRNRAPEVRQPAPAPMVRSEAPRYEGDRNRTYAAPDRDRTYSREAPRQVQPRQVQPRQQGWDGRQWQGQNRDRDRDRWQGDRRDNWSRDWRRDNRYNWQSWRSSNRQVYRLGRYIPPYRSYSYRRLSIGFSLDRLFFGANYWINDPWMYRLPPAYGPYRWVRYYDDALLVNIYDGEVVDVIYDFFW